MPSEEFTLVRIKKDSLKWIKRYCKIYKWTPSKLFEELAINIAKAHPDLFDKPLEQLREGLCQINVQLAFND